MIKTIDLFYSRIEELKPAKKQAEGRVPPANPSFAWHQLEKQAPGYRRQSDAHGRIGIALAYMLKNLEKPIRIPALGKIAGMSASHFYPLFKAATGCTPNDYFIRTRMRRACDLLRGTQLSVKEVAAALGYDDPYYFSRLFKSVNGVPPREFRLATKGLT